MSKLDHTLEPEARVRRVEVITGPGRRRRFSADEKARIVEETLIAGAVVSQVARRHGLTPQQVFTWRRLARQPAWHEPAMFVPAVIGASSSPSEHRHRRSRRVRKTARVVESSGLIELEIAGVAVRIGRGADAETVGAVIRALKAVT